ncbi:hypothetical protein [Corynebacterium riegelii]|uniref:hypothetical protein n=1 Tax=Corynebacterium riegelii TaxID=156976 RepID=UPI002889F76E|nr:hypothetical protein [Corynebacterium riegelii]
MILVERGEFAALDSSCDVAGPDDELLPVGTFCIWVEVDVGYSCPFVGVVDAGVNDVAGVVLVEVYPAF